MFLSPAFYVKVQKVLALDSVIRWYDKDQQCFCLRLRLRLQSWGLMADIVSDHRLIQVRVCHWPKSRSPEFAVIPCSHLNSRVGAHTIVLVNKRLRLSLEHLLTKWGYNDCIPSHDHVKETNLTFYNTGGSLGGMLPKRTSLHTCVHLLLSCSLSFPTYSSL